MERLAEADILLVQGLPDELEAQSKEVAVNPVKPSQVAEEGSYLPTMTFQLLAMTA